MRLVLTLAGLLGQAVADQCYVCTERFDSNGILQTDNRFVTKKFLWVLDITYMRYAINYRYFYRNIKVASSWTVKNTCKYVHRTVFRHYV